MLSQLGTDVATRVHEKRLGIIDIDIDIPKVRKLHVLDAILTVLAFGNVHSSIILVNDTIQYPISYINSLAVLMSQQNQFRQVMEHSFERLVNIYPFYDVEKLASRLFVKRLYRIDIDKLLTLTKDKEVWDVLFPRLLEEARDNNYILVLDNLQNFWNSNNKDFLYYQALSFFYSLRLNKMHYLAALTWNDYVYHIEQGMIPRLVEFSTPIFLTPRPQELPPMSIEDFSPDKNFDFQVT